MMATVFLGSAGILTSSDGQRPRRDPRTEFSYYANYRIGEAANPGPYSTLDDPEAQLGEFGMEQFCLDDADLQWDQLGVEHDVDDGNLPVDAASEIRDNFVATTWSSKAVTVARQAARDGHSHTRPHPADIGFPTSNSTDGGRLRRT